MDFPKLLGDIPIAFIVKSYTPDIDTTIATLKKWWYDNSYGKMNLDGRVFVVPFNAECNPTSMYDLASQFREAHPSVDWISQVFIGAPCNMGTWHGTYHGVAFVSTSSAWYVGHEMSHSLGIQHYHSLYTISNDAPITDKGGGDISGQNPLPSANKEGAGWLDTIPITQPGEYEIFPLESPTGNRSYRFTHPNPFSTMFPGYIYLSYPKVGTGVQIDFAQAKQEAYPTMYPFEVYLFLANGATYPTMKLGQEIGFANNVGVKMVKANSVSAIVQVRFDYQPPPPPPPTECVPLPDEYRTISCPKGYRGYIKQKRVSTCPGPTWGPWVEVENTCRKKGK